MMKRNTTILIFILITSITLNSCRSTKNTVNKPTKKDVEWLKSLFSDKDEITSINSKVDFKLSAQKGISTTMRGSLTFSKDSFLILSLQFTGIEMARCMIRPDSVFLLSRLHQLYASESIDRIPYLSFGLYSTLQDMIRHHVFLPGTPDPKERDLTQFVWINDKKETRLSLKRDDYTVSYLLNEDKDYSQMSLDAYQSKEAITLAYDRFSTINEIRFPQSMALTVATEKSSFNFAITYQKPVINGIVKGDFSISKKYKKVSLDELIKQFQDMI
jgi:hypothetical protein